MHGLRRQFLARAALANQQHGGLGRANLAQLVVDRLHGFGTAQQPAKAPVAAQLAAQRMDFRLQLAGSGNALEDGLEPRDVDRLDEVVGGAQAQRLHGALHAGVAGGQDDFHAGRAHFLEQLHAAAIGQAQVGQHRIGHAPANLEARLAQVAGGGGGKPLDRDNFCQRRASVFVVVYDQDVWHRLRWGPLARDSCRKSVRSLILMGPLAFRFGGCGVVVRRCRDDKPPGKGLAKVWLRLAKVSPCNGRHRPQDRLKSSHSLLADMPVSV
ncbi:hypothetical protein D3C81_1281700 [compost metagenome]